LRQSRSKTEDGPLARLDLEDSFERFVAAMCNSSGNNAGLVWDEERAICLGGRESYPDGRQTQWTFAGVVNDVIRNKNNRTVGEFKV